MDVYGNVDWKKGGNFGILEIFCILIWAIVIERGEGRLGGMCTYTVKITCLRLTQFT